MDSSRILICLVKEVTSLFLILFRDIIYSYLFRAMQMWISHELQIINYFSGNIHSLNTTLKQSFQFQDEFIINVEKNIVKSQTNKKSNCILVLQRYYFAQIVVLPDATLLSDILLSENLVNIQLGTTNEFWTETVKVMLFGGIILFLQKHLIWHGLNYIILVGCFN